MLNVARTAGVSPATVSNVLSGAKSVSPETRARVDRAIVELGYRPNRVARALIEHRTRTIGMVVPDIANPFFAEMTRAAEDVLAEAGYALFLGNSSNEADRERRYLEEFRDRQVDAVIVDATSDNDVEQMRELARRLPVVLVDRVPPGWEGDRVAVDNMKGLRLAVDHLANLGHRRIAFVNGDLAVTNGRERRAGFEVALARLGLAPASMTDGAFTFESGHAQAEYLLSLPTRPTAVCAGNDVLALALLLTAREHGLRVPENISLVGYDDSEYARLASPPLTTVRQRASDLGAAAARIALNRVHGGKEAPHTQTWEPSLVVRRSTAAVADITLLTEVAP